MQISIVIKRKDLQERHPLYQPPERTDTWPLQKIIANKEKIREKQRLPEFGGNGLGFLGQRPEGVPLEIDDMIRNQVAPVREVNMMQFNTV